MSYTQTLPSNAVYAGQQTGPLPDMEVYCLFNHDMQACIFHTRPFEKNLSWIEYDIASSRLDFIMEDGDIRNFGIPVDRKFAGYIKNMQTIPVVLRENGVALDGDDYPLIQHEA